jgi:metal-responsive CopG/Arc/MetJ family transcriptional regulator
MGRPSLGIVSTTVRLPKSVLERIDLLMGQNRRAQFIREAVVAELERRESQKDD